MIDADLVVRKQVLILRDLEALAGIARTPIEQFLALGLQQSAAERYLERIIGRMIDINYHVLTESGHAPPKDYYDSFVAMGSAGVLPVDFASRIASAAGLRNRIAHEYDDIEPARIHEAVGSALVTVPEFLRHVLAFVHRSETRG